MNLAERVGVEALKRTTRDEPDYDVLMRYRLDIMRKEGLTMHDVNAAIEAMDPLDGAPEMVAWLRERFQAAAPTCPGPICRRTPSVGGAGDHPL